MKVQHDDSGWHSLINNVLSEKPVDELEETNPELSQYSSISSLTNFSTARHLWERKNRQKLQKRHRFPPSLLTSRAADFWNTLMPLRANCSCSSVSVSEKCSRSSFGVSISDAAFSSNSDSSVSLIKDTYTGRETLGDTLEYTHLAFELLIARMARLLNISNENSENTENSEILLPPNEELKKDTEMIIAGSSLKSLSSKTSDHYRNHWPAGRIERKWESSSKFEIAEQKRKSFFSPTLLVPKNLRIPNSVLTQEELVYLWRYKKPLLSEYFQRKVDSTDLKKKLDSSERKTLIYETQSDSRLQEHNLSQFVQFIRARKKKDAEIELMKNVHSLETKELNTNSTVIENEDSRNLPTPKRRVTFSNPLADNFTSLLNCCSSNNEARILSSESFTTAITNDVDVSRGQNIQSDASFNSKSASPSDSSVSLKACVANLSLRCLSRKADELNPNFNESMTEIKFQENDPCYDTLDMVENDLGREADVINSVMMIEKSHNQSGGTGDLLNEFSSSAPASSLERLGKSGVAEGVEMIEEETCIGFEFLAKKILDRGTTHVPISDDLGSSGILKVGDAIPRVTFKECRTLKNVEKCLKRSMCPMKIRDNCDSVDNDGLYTWNCELEDESIRSKTTRFSDIRQSEIPVQYEQQTFTRSFSKEDQFSDTDVNSRPSLPLGKTVTFQDSCQTISDRSIISDRKEIQPSLPTDDKLLSSSESKGRFVLSWKGCWDQQSTTDFVENTEQFEVNYSEDEGQAVESNPTGIEAECVAFTPIKKYGVEPNLDSNNHEFLSAFSGTTTRNEIQLANNYRSRNKSRNLRATSLSNSPSFKAVAVSPEKDETIKSTEDIPKPCTPASKLDCDFESSHEARKLRHRTELRRGLGDVYKGIINPEIWRSEVRSKATSLSKSDWYTGRDSDKYSWKTSEIRNDWLIRRLAELQSCPETDCESDYCAESEVGLDLEYEKNLSLVKRSFSNFYKRDEDCRKFKAKRNRFGRNLFLNKVLSGKKIVFNECRCHKNTPSNRHDLRPTKHDLRHTSFQETDQRTNQNFFPHLRARIIVDSETDDSDFAPSLEPDFCYDFNHKDEHVNKIKCRRFVRSLRSIGSDEDRQLSSPRILHKNFQKSLSPASVPSAPLTRTVGTNVSDKQHFFNTMDVSIDTYDLCPREPIGSINKDSALSFLNKNSSSQTVESFFGIVNSFQCTEVVPQASPTQTERLIPLESNLKIPRSNKQRMSNALANLSTEINNASNNLAKLRFSDIKTEPKRIVLFPATEGDLLESSAKKSGNFLNNSNSSAVEKSSCPVCNACKKPTERYVLPACIVKGAGQDLKPNEKDPWNRVMEQAKAQHRYKEQNTSMCSEMSPSLKRSRIASSAHESVHSKSIEKNQTSFANDQSREEEVKIQLVQVKNNSSQAVAATDKIPSPPRIGSPFGLPPASELFSSASSDFSMFKFTKTRSPRRSKKPQATTNTSNRLLYIISETAELTNQMPIKSAAANLFT